jgi:putative transposase
MIDRSHGLSVAKQAAALKLSRSSVYYLPRPVSQADLAIMRRIDELHLDFPFAGSRMLRDILNAEGVTIGRRHVATLMRRMGLEAIYRKPNTSKPAPGHKIYPYLLRGHAPQPGLGHGHHLHSDGAGVRIPGGDRRLVQPSGPVVARLNHDGSGFLHRGFGRSICSPRKARHLQHRSGQPIHQRRFHRPAEAA